MAPMKVGDVVYLKADIQKELMTVAKLSPDCDGTSHDGQGVYCQWFVGTDLHGGWFSESSLVDVHHA